MPRCLLALGANLGDRRATLDAALAELGATPGVRVTAVSRAYETAPVGGPTGQPAFLNLAATIETSLSPEQLLAATQAIELAHGRQRVVRWDARTLDIDLLLYEDESLAYSPDEDESKIVCSSPELTLPHPRLAIRRFALEPAAQIVAGWVDPVSRWTIAELLTHLSEAPGYVAITGAPGVRKTALLRALAGRGLVAPLVHEPMTTQSPPSAESELALLQRRLQIVGAYDFASQAKDPSHALWAGSDFWYGQSLAYAQTLSADDFAKVQDAFFDALIDPAVITPKLLIVVAQDSGNRQAAEADKLERQLVDVVDKWHSGPWIGVSSADPAQLEAEVAAAIQAMR